jgi:ABC-2 type transport system permease protein
VVAAKGLTLAALWTAGYWLCYGITYGYNAWYWDNAVAQSLLFSAVCLWAFGLWVVSLTVLFSVLSDSNTGVFLGTGGVILLSYLLGMIPKVSRYLPTQLMDGNSLIYGLEKVRWYLPSMIIALGTVAGCVVAAIALFPKKQL